jgi:tRNA splicing ligase
MPISIDAATLIDRLSGTIGRLMIELETKEAALEKAEQIIADMEKAMTATYPQQREQSDDL